MKWLHPILGNIECHPYDGELDELWRPINAVGDLYRPGERLCGHKDCINSNHIITPAKGVVKQDKMKVEPVLIKELTPHNR